MNLVCPEMSGDVRVRSEQANRPVPCKTKGIREFPRHSVTSRIVLILQEQMIVVSAVWPTHNSVRIPRISAVVMHSNVRASTGEYGRILVNWRVYGALMVRAKRRAGETFKFAIVVAPRRNLSR